MYSEFKQFIPFLNDKKVYIDNETFRLHYRYTFSILLVASILASANQYIGKNIHCMADGGMPTDVLESFCWIQGTFTIPSQVDEKYFNMQGASNPSGADREKGDLTASDDGDETHHAWYQWMCFVLFLQAVMFYLPYYLWKSSEDGKLAMIIDGLDKPIIDQEKKSEKMVSLVDYLSTSRGTHLMYGYKFIFFQFLNLINVLIQVYLMDTFLGNQFTKYGLEVIEMSQRPAEARRDPITKVFPRIAKCTWGQWGPSGTQEIKDALCLLPINVLNEKVAILLWFWFILVIILTAVSLMYELVLASSYRLRHYKIYYNCKPNLAKDLDGILKKGNYGDWFLFQKMAKHMNPHCFERLIIELKNHMLPNEKRSVRVSELA